MAPMRRLTICSAVLALGLCAGAPALATDWNGVNWRGLTLEMQTYLCGRDAAPQWCPEWRKWSYERIGTAPNYAAELEEIRRKAAPPKPQDREKTVPDEVWKAVVAKVAAIAPDADDLATIEKRAKDDSDAGAYEILAYIYARGFGVANDLEKAYEYYGQAFIRGANHVKPNLDNLWKQLDADAQARMRQMFEKAAGFATAGAAKPAPAPASKTAPAAKPRTARAAR
jgi:TPR repeat protein